jgi:hypothetical protein
MGSVTPQAVIAISMIVGLSVVFCVLVIKIAGLAKQDAVFRDAFLKFVNPASIVSLLILMGVFFLLAMAILDLDKGRVLTGMGRATFARGLITYLFAVVTIGTAVVLVLSALIGIEKERFDSGKEVLGLLLGVFGTIVGFYFASELSQADERRLSASPVLVSASEASQGSPLTVTVSVQGGMPPYRFAVTVAEELPDDFPEIARPDGWILKTIEIPATAKPGVEPVRIGIQDSVGDRVIAQGIVKVTQRPGTQ